MVVNVVIKSLQCMPTKNAKDMWLTTIDNDDKKKR